MSVKYQEKPDSIDITLDGIHTQTIPVESLQRAVCKDAFEFYKEIDGMDLYRNEIRNLYLFYWDERYNHII